jgi:hypothetical protein
MQTDMMKVVGAFYKYVNVPENSKLLQYGHGYDLQLYAKYFLYV